MPRETSLSRLAQQVPSSLANAKKQLLQTASAGVNSNPREQRVQPKYLDISKYKSAQSNNFLRKNDAKSTLKPADQMKRSPSASSMGLSRGEGTRASNRSVRSAASAMNTSTTSLGGGNPGSRNSSAMRRDASGGKSFLFVSRDLLAINWHFFQLTNKRRLKWPCGSVDPPMIP